MRAAPSLRSSGLAGMIGVGVEVPGSIVGDGGSEVGACEVQVEVLETLRTGHTEFLVG
jgi:hypothetical protein